MRTTITLEDGLFYRLEAVAERSHRSFKEVLNETIKAGLSLKSDEDEASPPFSVKAFDSRVKAGIDEGRLNAYLDDLEAESFVAEKNSP
jgi:hypothetical protein